MNYSPPAGNAADLQITGADYVPPAGDAAHLTFAFNPTGVTELVWPIVADIAAVHGVISTFALTFPIGISAEFEVQFVGGVRAELRFEADISATQDVGGNLHADLTFIAEATGAAPVQASISANVAFVASGAVLVETTGTASVSIPVFVVGRGMVVATGEFDASLPFSAAGLLEHTQPRLGEVRAVLRPAVSSGGATGRAGWLSQPLCFSCHATAAHGRVGVHSSAMRFSISSTGMVGISGELENEIRFSANALGHAFDLVSAELAAELRFVPSIYSQDKIDYADAIFVHTRHEEVVCYVA